MTPFPPGPKGHPIVGVVPRFRAETLSFLLETSRTYGDLIHMRMGTRHVFLLNHPDLVQEVLVEKAEHFHKTPLFKRNTRQLIGTGLLTSEDALHRQQRRLVQPAFHHQRIAGYGDVMVAQALRTLEGWRDGAEIDVHDEMMRLTLAIVTRTLFDADVSEEAGAIGETIEAALRFVIRRSTNPLAPPLWIPTRENLAERRRAAFLSRVVLDIIEARRAAGDDRGDLLSMLLLARDEGERGMTDRQVRDEAMTLFIAGHETTANALTWTFFLLAQHPEIAATLRAELDRALAGRIPSAGDLPALPYTEMVIRESMRLYPPAWIVSRIAVDDVTIGGQALRRGNILLASPYALHRDARFFESPDQFMPERFAPEREKMLPRYAYFPFGVGPRVCIGNGFAMLEARLVLATLASQCDLSLVPGQRVVPEPLVTLRPKGGMRMRVKLYASPRCAPPTTTNTIPLS